MRAETIQASPYDPATEILVEKAIDRHACRAGNAFDDIVWNEWMADAVAKHRDEEDDALGGNCETRSRTCSRESSER